MATEGSKPNMDGILLFEQPFARVPYENYRKVFRTSQKHIERDFVALQTTAADSIKNYSDIDTSVNADALDSMISRVQNLKRKLSDINETTGKQTQEVMRERFNHLGVVESSLVGTDAFDRWADTRLDRWLVDWAFRTGKIETGQKITNERNIQSMVDADLFLDLRRIEQALTDRRCAEALAWCSENKTQLRKVKSTLEFELRLQEYIELARARRLNEAITYSKKHLIPWHETHLSAISAASNLLAFPPTTTCSPYKRLYDTTRWDALIKSFRLALYNLNTLPTEPLLHLALYAGLASLKLPVCFDHATKNPDCPVCDGIGSDRLTGLGKLAEEVPFSHHANSTIVCRISGSIMDADNMPMAFPNGYVYSREALEEMAANHAGMVKCPKTGQQCKFAELKKVFVS